MKTEKYAYQLVLVFQPKVVAKDRELIVDKINGMLSGVAGVVGNPEDMGTKELEYDIKGFKKGDFWKFMITTNNTFSFKEINLFLNREPQVIRYLVLKK